MPLYGADLHVCRRVGLLCQRAVDFLGDVALDVPVTHRPLQDDAFTRPLHLPRRLSGTPPPNRLQGFQQMFPTSAYPPALGRTFERCTVGAARANPWPPVPSFHVGKMLSVVLFSGFLHGRDRSSYAAF